jgi:cytochrome c oxidase subunit 3
MTTITMDNINLKEEHKKKTSKPLIWIAIVSIIMFFSGLTSAVVVSQGGGGFIDIELPLDFTVSTLIIILSSATFYLGFRAIKNEKLHIAKIWISATLVFGLLFVLSQYLGWVNLYHRGIFAVGNQSTQESSYLYLLTALHVAHLVGGLVSLIIVLVKTIKGKYSLDNYLGIQVSITYWHFLGALWIYLFFFLRYIIA